MATKLTLRNTKGSPLTFQEGDDNFIYVDEKATAGIAIGKVYDTKEAGLAAVRDTDTFWVQGSGDIGAILYRRVNLTTATELKRVLSDQFKADLAGPAKGPSLIGFEDVTVQDVLSRLIPMGNYTALRGYSGKGTAVQITQVGLAGLFHRDDGDDSSVDNGGTTIVDAVGRRWKRLYTSAITPGMFEIDSNSGEDVYENLQKMFDASIGKIVSMPSDGVFNVGSSSLQIKDNTTIYWNNSKIHRDTAINNYCLNVIGFGVTFNGALNITGTGERGWRISGDFCSFDDGVFVLGDSPGTGAGNILKDALRIESLEPGKKVRNARGFISIENYDMGVCSKGASDLSIKVAVKTYRTAVWLKDTDNFSVSGWVSGTSPTCTGRPGENAFLVESTTPFSSHSGRIEMTAQDSGEHGFRVGGGQPVRDIWFYNCVARRTGQGIGTGVEPDSHGGCGFKVLGPTTTSSSYHHNIHFIDCVAEDIRIEPTEHDNWNNFDGFSIGKVVGGSLVNPMVKRSDFNDSSSFSSLNGIHIYGSQGIKVTNPYIDKPSQHGIFFDELPNSQGVNFGNFNEDITVLGGDIGIPGEDGIRFRTRTLTFRRIRIDGLQVNGGKTSIRFVVDGGGGSINCSARMTGLNPSVGLAIGTGAFRMNLSGTSGSADAANGSTLHNWGAGEFQVRKSGAWVAM